MQGMEREQLKREKTKRNDLVNEECSDWRWRDGDRRKSGVERQIESEQSNNKKSECNESESESQGKKRECAEE